MATSYAPRGMSLKSPANQGKKVPPRRPPVNPSSAQFGTMRSQGPEGLSKPKWSVQGPGGGSGSPPSTDQYGQPWMRDPEDRWAQTEGALPYGTKMTGGENKANFTQYLYNQWGIGQDRPDWQGTADQFYNADMVGGAQNYLGGMNSYQYNPSQWAGGASDMIGRYNQNAPQPVSAPTSYQHLNAPGSVNPQYDQLRGTGFDPSGISGPNMRSITMPSNNYGMYDPSGLQGPRSRNISGPDMSQFGGPANDYTQLRSDIMGANSVPRENLTGSGFENSQLFGNPNSIANRGFENALSGAGAMQNAGLDDQLYKDSEAAIMKSLGAVAGASGIKAQRDVGSRGYLYSPGTGVSDEAYALHYAPALAETNEKLMALNERNTDRAIDQRKFGTSTSVQLGSAASDAAQGNAGLLTNENQFLGGARVQQRGQDIEQGGRMAGNLIDIAGNRREDFNAGTNRGQAVSQLQQQADEAMQNGDMESYRNLTDRINTMGGLWESGASRDTDVQQLRLQAEEAYRRGDIDAYNSLTDRINTMGNQASSQYDAETRRYGAYTDRGRVNAEVEQNAQRMGIDVAQINQRYDEMGASNLKDFFSQQLGAFSGDTDRMSSMLGAMESFAQLDQNGQIEAARSALEMGGMMAQIIQSGANVHQAADELAYRAKAGDEAAKMELFTFLYSQGQQAQQTREANRFNFGRDALGGLISAGGQIGAAIATGGASEVASTGKS